VALATGMVWLADGSDLGGSLRTPASFCGVVGLRPSPGRVPHGPAASPFQTLGVAGPMARDVRDAALMLDAQAGLDPRDPLTFEAPARSFAQAADRPARLGKVAFSADLGGITPVDAEVAGVCRAAAARFAELGAEVLEASPDLGAAVEVFTVLRAEAFVASRAPLLERHRDRLKPEMVWNIERGLGLTADEIGRAERERGLMQRRTAAFLADHDLLLCPAAIVPPFPVERRYVEELNGHRFPSYIDWVAISYAITLTGCPRSRCPAASPGPACRSASRSSARPRARRSCWPPRRCWRICSAWAAGYRSTRGPADRPASPRPDRVDRSRSKGHPDAFARV
jgi:amidase